MKCMYCNTEIKDNGKDQCFSCQFWNEHLLKDASKNKSRFAIISGEHYLVGAEKPNKHNRGFAGAKFTIEFYDGRAVSTQNLWHQGKIPELWRQLMPDNAKFRF